MIRNNIVPANLVPLGWTCDICDKYYLLQWELVFGLCHCTNCKAPYTYKSEETPGVPYCRIKDEWLDACKLYWERCGKDVAKAPAAKLHQLRAEIVKF